MGTFKVYYNDKLMGKYVVPKVDTIKEFQKTDFYLKRFGDPEYTTWYKVTKIVVPSTKKRLNKAQALVDFFGYSKKEARAMLKDMGE
jgi:hypothetical protein